VNGVARRMRLSARAASTGRPAHGLRVTRHVFQIDAGERDAEFLFGAGERRKHDLVQQIGAGMRFVVVLDRPRRTQDIVGGDTTPVAGELVATVRTADAFEDAAANQRLQHGFKMPRRQAMPRGQRFCGDWMPGSLHRHVDDCSYGKDSFARKQRHGAGKTSLERNCLTAAIITYNYWAVQLNFALVTLVDNIRHNSGGTKACTFTLGGV